VVNEANPHHVGVADEELTGVEASVDALDGDCGARWVGDVEAPHQLSGNGLVEGGGDDRATFRVVAAAEGGDLVGGG
jgi:hypothetical protein